MIFHLTKEKKDEGKLPADGPEDKDNLADDGLEDEENLVDDGLGEVPDYTETEETWMDCPNSQCGVPQHAWIDVYKGVGHVSAQEEGQHAGFEDECGADKENTWL